MFSLSTSTHPMLPGDLQSTQKIGSFKTSRFSAIGCVAKGTDITIVITGGANAGSYHIAVPVSTCSLGMTGDSSYGNQYSEEGKEGQ